MKAPAPVLRVILFAFGAGVAPILLRAQDVGADTPINDPTPAGVRIFADLAYVEGGSARQKLDLYLPFPMPTRPLPVIVYLHGGGWQKGSKADGRRFAFRMVAQGYAVACLNYRLSGEAAFPSQVEDCKVALRWLRDYATRYRLDRDHFGVVGISAGGYLAAMLGAAKTTHLFDNGEHLGQSSSVLAVCDFFGPIDLLRWYETCDDQKMPGAGEAAKFLGANPRLDRDLTRTANPITYLESDSPPFLLIHGAEDTVVPPEQSQLLYDAMARKGLSVHLHLIHGAGHTGPAFVAPEINRMVDEFFERALKPVRRTWEAPRAVLTESTAHKD